MLNSKDEIMLKFAENIGMHKTAEENALYWQNLVKNLIPALATLPLDFVTAGGSTGLKFAILSTFSFAGAGLLSVWDKADNSLTELIEALDALDREEGTSAAALIDDPTNGWIAKLKGFKEAMVVKPAQGQEYIDNELRKINTVDEIIAYLQQMKAQWLHIKQKEGGAQDYRWLGDWGDLREAEITLDQTLKAQESIKIEIRAELTKAAEEYIKQYNAKNKTNIKSVARDALNKYNTLSKALDSVGEIINLNKNEIYALNFAKNIVDNPGEIFIEDQSYAYLVAFNTEMDRLIAKHYPKIMKTQSAGHPHISKRAAEVVPKQQTTSIPDSKVTKKIRPESKSISQRREPKKPVPTAVVAPKPIDRGEQRGCPTMVMTKDLKDAEIDACLNLMRLNVRGKERWAKEYLMDKANALTPTQRADILRAAFKNLITYHPPNEWMSWGPSLVSYIETNYPKSGGKFSI